METRWRTQDIVVAAVIAVAFGVVFWAWNLVWAAAEPAFLAAPPARNILYGVWLIPAVLGALIIRKPGAALFTELVAAIVSAILGSIWGLDTVLSGFMQGAAAELVFAFTGYRLWTLPLAAIAGAAAAAGAWLHDMPIYYAELPLEAMLVIGAFMLVSAVVVAGVGSWLLMRSLAETGVLSGFPSGRTAGRV
ncbi:MAG TPA: ECF transporter S component [Candidatus Limnocylindrales bacterium]|nr:ECF transporter S component [Candidatus Limnocylindrales bacterium]